jgi:hypothetical protein
VSINSKPLEHPPWTFADASNSYNTDEFRRETWKPDCAWNVTFPENLIWLRGRNRDGNAITRGIGPQSLSPGR